MPHISYLDAAPPLTSWSFVNKANNAPQIAAPATKYALYGVSTVAAAPQIVAKVPKRLVFQFFMVLKFTWLLYSLTNGLK